MSVVTVQDVSKTFGSGHTAVTAVDHVSLSVDAGDIVLVMGPSGSGKTTLLSMIGTLMSPTSGRILIAGQDTSTLSPAQLSRMRLREFGFVFQTFNLLSALTAEENVMMPLLTAGVPRKQARAKARAALEQLRLGHRLRNLPRDLSGGEKQRVAIARSLANDPRLILADEPTANLDGKTGQDVTLLLCETACSENRAVIIVSHDQRLRTAAKRVITIEDGRLSTEEAGEHNLHCSMHPEAAPT
ncbi:ATP-binding cassette domain-containing protein [Pseudarthrobacter sp. AG30]|uniref:ABC transporter ATP-binding protein n=1 Tax=unclassified Pseudarthrobacter TaxID=2647000 RepID=UPI000D64D95B|nr:ABC transporter ATP-binding protein [Pseudarthrobacter sp. AG30]RAX16261.1 ATP-binding cassette domain-containing protein [Pseudarthrobacter sp. AG30]